MATLLPPPQKFTVQTGRDTVLRGKEGTLLRLPAGCFVDAQGIVAAGPVQIELEEFYTTDAILAAGLHSQSRGRLLETGGMIYWTARSGGKELSPARGSGVSVGFPASDRDGMQLFAGVDRNGKMDWEAVEGGVQVARAYEPARYPGGTQALALHFQQFIDTKEVILPGERRRFTLLLRIGADGKGSLLSITPEAPPDLLSSVQAALKNAERWQAALRVGVPTWDTCRHYLNFEWSIDLPQGDTFFTAAQIKNWVKDKAERRESDAMLALNNAMYFLMRNTSMGWMNCDRFINDPRPRVEFVQRADTRREQVKVLCHSVRCFLEGIPSKDGWHFSGLPKGERITVMAMRKVGTEFHVAFAELTAGEAAPVLTYERMTPAEIKQRLQVNTDLAAR